MKAEERKKKGKRIPIDPTPVSGVETTVADSAVVSFLPTRNSFPGVEN